MDTKLFNIMAFLLCLGSSIESLPVEAEKGDNSFVGIASDIATVALLRSTMDKNDNSVFSPIGYTNILSILSEGAKGQTQDEIFKVFRQPDDLSRLRSSYKEVLARYQGDDPSMSPQFKTWFYIYKNNTVERDFVKTLTENYFVDVRMIDRNFYDFDQPKPPTPNEDQSTVEEQEKPVEPEFNKENLDDVGLKIALKTERMDSSEIDEIIRQKECSKFDEVIDDQQYVEVPMIKEQIKKTSDGIVSLEPVEDNETVLPIEKLEESGKKDFPKSEKLETNDDGSLKNLEDMEILQIAKKHPVTKKFQAARSLEDVSDVSSALSGNSLIGKKEGKSNEFESKILLFNGLYFRGRWATPFQKLRSNAVNDFHISGRNRSEVAMMRSRGEFRVVESAKYKCRAIEMPYENKRYAMIIVTPNESDGLRRLTDQLEMGSLNEILNGMAMITVELSLPKFSIETTRRVEKEFIELGIPTLFSENADLSGITKDQPLRVDELVQHVSVRLDEGASSENGISAANGVRKKSADPLSDETFIVDRPFLFFVRDMIDGITIVAGKINEPSGPEKFATSFF